jgi:hypothetical protein
MSVVTQNEHIIDVKEVHTTSVTSLQSFSLREKYKSTDKQHGQ